MVALVIFTAYFVYVTLHFGVEKGIVITLLTWSFFVMCTPIADAGLLLDFPLRILTGIRMIKAELLVWAFAITLNVLFLLFNPSVYESTALLRLFHHILTTPVPFWLIIILSAAGTFLSIHFGDELLDVLFHSERRKYFLHKEKYELVAYLAIILLIVAIYDYLLNELGIKLF